MLRLNQFFFSIVTPRNKRLPQATKLGNISCCRKQSRRSTLSFILLAILFSTTFLFADKQQFAELGDFQLLNGQTIKNCRIGFRTYGRLNAQKSNAILFPTWFGGQSKHLGAYVGPGKLIDSTKYFIIAVDALGNGISSSPSNSRLQPGNRFPRFTIADMVRSQHALLTQHLHINHLFAIIGGSMGGMQTFEWMVRYPNFMDKAIPYVGTPKFSGYDILEWRQALNMIEIGRRYHVHPDSIRGMLNAFTTLLVRTPQWIANHYYPQKMDSVFAGFFKGEPKIFTNDNFASQVRAMLSHDISKNFDGSLKAAAEHVKAKVLIIQVSTDHMVNPLNALRFADYLHAKTLVLKSDCGHLGIGCNLQKVSEAIAQFLAE